MHSTHTQIPNFHMKPDYDSIPLNFKEWDKGPVSTRKLLTYDGCSCGLIQKTTQPTCWYPTCQVPITQQKACPLIQAISRDSTIISVQPWIIALILTIKIFTFWDQTNSG